MKPTGAAHAQRQHLIATPANSRVWHRSPTYLAVQSHSNSPPATMRHVPPLRHGLLVVQGLTHRNRSLVGVRRSHRVPSGHGDGLRLHGFGAAAKHTHDHVVSHEVRHPVGHVFSFLWRSIIWEGSEFLSNFFLRICKLTDLAEVSRVTADAVTAQVQQVGPDAHAIASVLTRVRQTRVRVCNNDTPFILSLTVWFSSVRWPSVSQCAST